MVEVLPAAPLEPADLGLEGEGHPVPAAGVRGLHAGDVLDPGAAVRRGTDAGVVEQRLHDLRGERAGAVSAPVLHPCCGERNRAGDGGAAGGRRVLGIRRALRRRSRSGNRDGTGRGSRPAAHRGPPGGMSSCVDDEVAVRLELEVGARVAAGPGRPDRHVAGSDDDEVVVGPHAGDRVGPAGAGSPDSLVSGGVLDEVAVALHRQHVLAVGGDQPLTRPELLGRVEAVAAERGAGRAAQQQAARAEDGGRGQGDDRRLPGQPVLGRRAPAAGAAAGR